MFNFQYFFGKISGLFFLAHVFFLFNVQFSHAIVISDYFFSQHIPAMFRWGTFCELPTFGQELQLFCALSGGQRSSNVEPRRKKGGSISGILGRLTCPSWDHRCPQKLRLCLE